MRLSIEDLMDRMYNENNKYKFEVNYITIKKGTKKTDYFETIEQVKKWCKSHKDKVIIRGGSWQLLDIWDSL